MNKTLKGYQRPSVLKLIPLEMEHAVLADSKKTIQSTSIETEGQSYQSYNPDTDASFTFTWQ